MSDKPTSMTARQEKWFASILESMERETGKTLDEWVAIARTCPETKPAARKAWFKAQHGIGTNRASVIFGQAFPESAHWAEPDSLRDTLWADAGARAILEAIEWAITRGLGRVEAGAQGQHKIARGYLPTPVYSAHWIADPRLREPIARYLAQERPAVENEMAYLEAEYSPFKHEQEPD